jgi:hypothetical protein
MRQSISRVRPNARGADRAHRVTVPEHPDRAPLRSTRTVAGSSAHEPVRSGRVAESTGRPMLPFSCSPEGGLVTLGAVLVRAARQAVR